MAIPWLMALKVIPWGDVIEHAPSVLKAARKLMDRQPPQPPGQAGTPATTTPVSAVPSLGELKNALIDLQGRQGAVSRRAVSCQLIRQCA